jgi:hypothetical protein
MWAIGFPYQNSVAFAKKADNWSAVELMTQVVLVIKSRKTWWGRHLPKSGIIHLPPSLEFVKGPKHDISIFSLNNVKLVKLNRSAKGTAKNPLKIFQKGR